MRAFLLSALLVFLALPATSHSFPGDRVQGSVPLVASYDTPEITAMVLPETGTYPVSLHHSLGCDPNDPPLTESIAAEICQGQSYDFHGQTLYEAGTYEVGLTSVGGCDSIVTLDLNVLPPLTEYLTAEVCYGLSYHFDGIDLTESGIYTEELTSVDGCDSIVILELTVLPPVEDTIKATICEGESYYFYGQQCNESGTCTMSVYDEQGCEVTYTLELTVLPVLTEDLEITICQGEAYVIPGSDTELTSSGTYTGMFTSSMGCDSVVTLMLTVEPVAVEEIAVTIEAGDSYLLPDGSAKVTTSGTYSVTLTSSQGCDSVVIVDLVVLPFPDPAPTVEIVEAKDELEGGKRKLMPDGFPRPWLRTSRNTESSGQEIAFDVYPNPCGDQLTFATYGPELPNTATVQLLDLSGREIPLTVMWQPGAVPVDIAHVPPGVYLLRLTREGRQLALARIVKYWPIQSVRPEVDRGRCGNSQEASRGLRPMGHCASW